jgi:hypothetical protein
MDPRDFAEQILIVFGGMMACAGAGKLPLYDSKGDIQVLCQGIHISNLKELIAQAAC